ncbi:MAG: DUF2232 domain-containing protein [gamma proteobacterium symbiont of Bathyaustriella thionipta]|nr:DUF2232 domain-containing protein [gamma proteobacterium symbiont of Bathyaustriella thionipta]
MLLAFFVPPLSILSSATIALVTLRKSAKQGLFLVFVVTLLSGVFYTLVMQQPASQPVVILLGCLSIWLLALLLRLSRRLNVALEAGLLLTTVFLLILLLLYPLGGGFWQQQLDVLLQNMQNTSGSGLAEDQQELLGQLWLRWAPAGFAAGIYLQLALTLLLARWWQALLFNPGGFQQEFHALRLHYWVAFVVLAAALISQLLSSGPSHWAAYILLLFGSGLFIQGLAVVHGVVGKAKAHVAWLIAVYVFMLLALPQVAVLLAFIGLSDRFLDFRMRVNNNA